VHPQQQQQQQLCEQAHHLHVIPAAQRVQRIDLHNSNIPHQQQQQ
jgi:hypothetical protein